MSAPIGLFFYRAKSGVPNFGDELSPEIVSFLTGRRVDRAGRWLCELTGIGSILDRYVAPKGRAISAIRAAFGRPVTVWGSGLISDRQAAQHSLNILAVRGKLTRDALSAPPETPLGDPGLLVAKMMKIGRPRKGIGIVPHYTDKQHKMVKALSSLQGVRVIDVERGGSEVCADIAECSVVFSSSLHGLIVADAFGIPNQRLKFAGNLKGGDFKFLDYASALGRQEILARHLSAPDEVFSLAKQDFNLDYLGQVDRVCGELEHALRRMF
jgi:pyruvyltransferase